VENWRIDVVSDAICPWCWVGKRNLTQALARIDARFDVHWRPYQLNPEMPRDGVQRDVYRTAKFGSLERSRELDTQVAAAGGVAGVTFRHDRMRRTPNTIDAHRVIRLAGEAGPPVQDAVVEALFVAYFQDGIDIGDHAALADVAAAAGLDGVAAFLATDAGEAAVREEDAGFRRLGISGVPTFALGGHILFSGAMPPDRMIEAFERALVMLRQRAA